MHRLLLTLLIAAPLIHAAPLPDSSPTSAGKRADAGFPMVDPSLDQPDKPWCYFTHPVTCIGMPWQPDPIGIQITPEGNVFTGRAEFCLFWGSEQKPLACRQRQFLEGWIPVVGDHWMDGSLRYSYEAFGTTLPCDPENKNTAIFVSLTVTNTGSTPAPAEIAGAFRQNGGAHRERDGGFDPNWYYSLRDNQLWRGAQKDKLELIGLYTPPSRWEAVNGEPYQQPFRGCDLGIMPRTEVGIARYREVLAPGASKKFIFKFPRVPASDERYLAELAAADYEASRQQVIEYWQHALNRYSVIRTPGEPIIGQSHRATAVHVMLATRTYADGKTQTDGLPYPDLFLTTAYDYAALYNAFGLQDFLRVNFPHFTARQQPDGLLVDTALSHGQKIFCGHGQPLAAMAGHILLTRDIKLGKEYFPVIRKGIECIIRDSESQPHGLMRASIPYDNEMISGQYTCHNYWSLIALRSAICLASFLGEQETAVSWRNFHDRYEALVIKAVRESAAQDGYVPTGLYGIVTGEAARGGFAEFRTDQDWENGMLLWPTELVQPGDPLVKGTLNRLRATKYREGIMTYRNGQHLHQYMTSRCANQYILNGQPKEALIDTYHALLHSGSASESFENMIRPWTDRDVEFCPPPHAWGCSTYNGLIRNLFIMEYGGHGGLEMNKRDLMLFNAVSPAWLKAGEPMGIENAPTMFGTVTALMTPRSGGADISLKTDLHTKPRSLCIRIPYFAKLRSFTTDAMSSRQEGDLIRLSPDATKLSLEWSIDPKADEELYQSLLLRYRRELGFWPGKRSEAPATPEGFLTPDERTQPIGPLSFQLVLTAWKAEYARRFEEHLKQGGSVKAFQPLAMQTSEQRHVEGARFRPLENLASKGKVTCSSGSSNPEAANDGHVDNGSFWECNTSDAWWQVDLGDVKSISTLNVIPLHKDNRGYRFVVKTSVDGTHWTVHIDKRDNTQSFGARGCEEKFQSTPMRHIRVEMFGNTLNAGNHLVELLAN